MIKYQLHYFDEVEYDIQDAKKWYKEQKEGLESEFGSAVEEAIKLVVEKPKLYAVRYKKIRIAHPKKFPYNIHFYIDEPSCKVIIVAIVHSNRHPKISRNRKE